jgi:hypothetical protein
MKGSHVHASDIVLTPSNVRQREDTGMLVNTGAVKTWMMT